MRFGNTCITNRGRFRNTARLVQLDEDPWQLGKNYPLEVGLIGSTKAGLAELDVCLAENGHRRRSANRRAQRTARYTEQHLADRQRLEERVDRETIAAAAYAAGLDEQPGQSAALLMLPSSKRRSRRPTCVFERLGVLEERERIFRPSRLGAGLGHGLRHRREARLARAAGAGDGRRRLGDVRRAGTVVGGEISRARDVCRTEQRAVSES